MKILFKTFALSAVIALASCSKDNSNNNNNTGNNGGNNNVTLSGVIEGDWEIVGLEQRNGTVSLNGQTVYTFSGVGRDFTGKYTFNADGSLSGNIGYKMDMTLNYPNMPAQTQVADVPTTPVTGSYSVISNTKIAAVGPDGETGTYTVSNLSANTMTWTLSHNVTQSQGGQTMDHAFELEIKYKKK